jgi:hypothetical protein
MKHKKLKTGEKLHRLHDRGRRTFHCGRDMFGLSIDGQSHVDRMSISVGFRRVLARYFRSPAARQSA